MIGARILLDGSGRLVRLSAEGHGGSGPRGGDIVCAAFTVLVRTAYECLAALPGAEVDGTAPEPGSLQFVVRRYGEEGGERAAGIADFLLAGISGLEREYPGKVGLTIERYWRE